MNTKNPISGGLMAILVIGLVFMVGCVQEKNPAQEENPKELSLEIGETLKTDVFDVTVFSVQRKKPKIGLFCVKNPEYCSNRNRINIVIGVEIKNHGLDTARFYPSNFYVSDSEYNRYYMDPGLSGFTQLYLHQKKKREIVILSVPDNATGLKIQYKTGNKTVTWPIS